MMMLLLPVMMLLDWEDRGGRGVFMQILLVREYLECIWRERERHARADQSKRQSRETRRYAPDRP